MIKQDIPVAAKVELEPLAQLDFILCFLMQWIWLKYLIWLNLACSSFDLCFVLILGFSLITPMYNFPTCWIVLWVPGNAASSISTDCQTADWWAYSKSTAGPPDGFLGNFGRTPFLPALGAKCFYHPPLACQWISVVLHSKNMFLVAD